MDLIVETNNMKNTLLLISFTLLIACHSKSKSENAESQLIKEASAKNLETHESLQTVISFLKWYRANYKEVNSYEWVNYMESMNDSTKYYSVNFAETDKYLEKMKSSTLLSVEYLETRKSHFIQCEKNFQKNPQTDGPPEGFDYDLVLLTQEIDETLSSIEKPIVIKVSESSEKATVNINIYMKLSFTLTKLNGKWLIDKIERYSE